jgi:diguanylate cyclase (GGDEF)-like protein
MTRPAAYRYNMTWFRISSGTMKLETAEYTAINALTQQTGYRGLCDCLLASIESIAEDIHATLLEVYDDRGYASWQEPEPDHMVVRQYPTLDNRERPSWLVEAIAASPPAGTIKMKSLPASELVCVGGVAGVWRFIEISGRQNPGVKNTIERLAGVFANLMRLIDRFERDPLTQLLNRQSFDSRFEDLIEYHQRNPHRKRTDDMPWLAIADIDHFKHVNDTFGHLFGDEILLLVSRIMRQSFRFDDLLFRYGGEEFIIILNNADAVGAEFALERFRQAIQEYGFPRLDEMTISIGWAGVAVREFATDVIHKADKALYYAKEHGRNRIVNYEAVFGDVDDPVAGVGNGTQASGCSPPPSDS